MKEIQISRNKNLRRQDQQFEPGELCIGWILEKAGEVFIICWVWWQVPLEKGTSRNVSLFITLQDDLV